NRNSGDVERVARVRLERADAAFAEDDVVIPAGENVFRAEQKFFHRCGHAAFEKDGLTYLAESAQEIVILHVAGAHLKDVDIFGHHRNLRKVHHLADGEQIEFVSGFAHEFEAGLAHALKSVRRSARLESPSAQNLCTGFRDAFRDGENLLARL